MTLIELINSYRLISELESKPLPAKLAYAITRNIDKMMPYLQSFESARKKAIENDDVDSLEEIVNEEVDENWYMIDPKYLPDEIELKYVVALKFMLKDEE